MISKGSKTICIQMRRLSGGCSTRNVDSFVRNAQAAELFRSAYFNNKNGESAIPVEDLDQLVVREHVRPSISTSALTVLGGGLGLMSRFAPKFVSDTLSEAVDDATVQQFNDSVRTMQLDAIENVDVKETLKYHRDLRGFETQEEEQQTLGNDTQMGGPEEGASVVNSKTALTSVLYHVLKVSEKY